VIEKQTGEPKKNKKGLTYFTICTQVKKKKEKRTQKQ